MPGLALVGDPGLFRTEAGLAHEEATLQGGATADDSDGVATTCSSPLNLYSGPNYTGLHLCCGTRATGRSCSDDGFAGLTVSFIGGACGFHLAQRGLGIRMVVSRLHRTLGLRGQHGLLGYTVSSVYID